MGSDLEPMIAVDIRANLKPLQKAFIALQAKQVPFATALALTRLAKGTQGEEAKAIAETFTSPTPFTRNAVAVMPATKSRQVSTVYARQIAAQYLAPYVVGGDRYLGTKQGMLAPRAVGLNQYGNLSKGKLAALKAKPNVYIGKVTTKSGKVINGVWQRPSASKGKRRGAVTKPSGKLKLLIQFEDTTPTRKHLPFIERARTYVQRNAAREFEAAMRQALSTSR